MLVDYILGYKYIIDTDDIKAISSTITELNKACYEPVCLDFVVTIDISVIPVIIELLAQKNLTVVGVISESADILEFAKISNLAIIAQNIKVDDEPTHLFANKPSIIRGNVTKDEQIYAKNTDLIVLGDVSDKAEVMSDKNIYVYGRSYGKIVAGVKSNQDAKVFVNFFASKSVCIADICHEFDNISSEYYNKPIEITVVNGSLNFRVLL